MAEAFYQAVVRSRRRGHSKKLTLKELLKAEVIIRLLHSSKAFKRYLRKEKLAAIGRITILEGENSKEKSGFNYLERIVGYAGIEESMSLMATLHYRDGIRRGIADEKKNRRKQKKK